MKTLIAIVIIVALMVFAGSLTISRTDDRAVINIETKEIREDTEKAVEKGKELSEEADRKAKEMLRETRDRKRPSDRAPEPTTSLYLK